MEHLGRSYSDIHVPNLFVRPHDQSQRQLRRLRGRDYTTPSTVKEDVLPRMTPCAAIGIAMSEVGVESNGWARIGFGGKDV